MSLALVHVSVCVRVCTCVWICISWLCKLTLGCSRLDLSEQLKEDFCWICGPSDIINCTVRPRQSFPPSSSRVQARPGSPRLPPAQTEQLIPAADTLLPLHSPLPLRSSHQLCPFIPLVFIELYKVTCAGSTREHTLAPVCMRADS